MIQSAPSIERFNTIVVWPGTGLTITLDENGKTKISNATFATQFEPKTAKFICANCKNGADEYPVCMNPIEYYTMQKTRLVESIDFCNEMLLHAAEPKVQFT